MQYCLVVYEVANQGTVSWIVEANNGGEAFVIASNHLQNEKIYSDGAEVVKNYQTAWMLIPCRGVIRNYLFQIINSGKI